MFGMRVGSPGRLQFLVLDFQDSWRIVADSEGFVTSDEAHRVHWGR